MENPADRGAAKVVPPSAYRAAPGSPGAGREPPEPGFLAPFERIMAALKRMLSNYSTLAVLDLRRAVVQFAWLIAGGIFITVLVVSAWLAAVVALAAWLLGAGLSWPAVLLIAGAINLVGAAIAGMRIKHVFEHVPFSATLRQLKSDDDEQRASSTPQP